MTIDVNGIRTNVLDTVHDPGGGTVLLIHGSGPGVSAWANWRLTLPVLAQHYRVVAPDVVGFGYSDHPVGPYTPTLWLDHVRGVLDTLDIKQAHVMGNSFGGSLALGLAIHAPERVRHLVLMGSAGTRFALTEGLDAVWGYQPSVQAMRNLLDIFTYDTSPNAEDLARLRYEASVRPGVSEAYAVMFPAPRQQGVDALAHDDALINGITSPTLIVHGREDRVIPLSSSMELLRLIPDAQLHVFGCCGHWTQIEHADAFNRLVLGFLSPP
jgi:2-hydroxymuconate-semialdehyde hydrolase